VTTIEKKEKNNVFVLPLVGGIFCLLTVFMPVMSRFYWPNNFSYWIWGLRFFNELSFNTERIDILVVGIIIGILMLLCGIKLIYSANLVRKNKISFNRLERIWIIFPSIVVIGAIIWYFFISIAGDGYFVPSGYDTWDIFRIDLGLIGAFTGGTLTWIGYLFNRVVHETNIISYFITTPRKEISLPRKKFPPPEIQKIPQIKVPNFCPMCGFKIATRFKFCPGCGFKF
jgi:hypothetical protein